MAGNRHYQTGTVEGLLLLYLTFLARKTTSCPRARVILQVFLGFNLLTSVDGQALLRVSGGLTELHIQVTFFLWFLEFVGNARVGWVGMGVGGDIL